MPFFGGHGQAMKRSGVGRYGYLTKNGIRSPSECLHAANNGKVRFEQESPPPIGATSSITVHWAGFDVSSLAIVRHTSG